MSEIDVPSGTSSTFVTLNAGDVMKVFGNAQFTQINSGGQQIIEPGGSAGSVTAHGGMIEIDSGGHAEFTNLYDGSTLHILAGGSAFGTYLTNSTQFLDAGASDNYVNVYGGGVDHISGSSNSITIQTGGLVELTQAGYASGATLSDPSQAPTSFVGDVTIQGGELRIEAGAPTAVNFQSGQITLPFLHYDGSITSSYDSTGNGGLTISGNGGSYNLALSAPPMSGSYVVGGNPAGETIVTVAAPPVCFCAGTLIATPEGQRPVETLAPGDRVLNVRGEVRIVRWIGSGSEIATAVRRPILLRRGALAEGVPFADLRVTPGHAFLLEGVLIPVEVLANGRSILPDETMRHFRYFHVELDDHDVILANGAQAESYRDDGNRQAFSEAAGSHLPAGMPPCAPIVSEGEVVDRVWTRLSRRARVPAPALGDDPHLRLRIGERLVDPALIDGDRYTFIVPEAAEEVAVVSRASIPANLGLCRDHRRLGVAIRSLETERLGRTILHRYDDAIFACGFHAPEPSADMRWTDGDARLRWPEPLAAGARLTIEVACLTRYATDAPAPIAV